MTAMLTSTKWMKIDNLRIFRLASLVSLHRNKRFGICSTFYVTSRTDYHSDSMVTCCVYREQTSSLNLHCFCSVSRYGSSLKLLKQDSVSELTLLMKHIKLFLSAQRVKASSDLRILYRNLIYIYTHIYLYVSLTVARAEWPTPHTPVWHFTLFTHEVSIWFQTTFMALGLDLFLVLTPSAFLVSWSRFRRSWLMPFHSHLFVTRLVTSMRRRCKQLFL